jgi:hypothetical protein
MTIALFVIVSFFSECKKYPDGPRLSFRSRATRIATTWYLDLYLLNGNDQTTTYVTAKGDSYALTITKDGAYQESGNFPDEGKCQFGDKHESLYGQSFAVGGEEQKYSILRLEYKSLWLKHIKANGDVEEIHYIAYR